MSPTNWFFLFRQYFFFSCGWLVMISLQYINTNNAASSSSSPPSKCRSIERSCECLLRYQESNRRVGCCSWSPAKRCRGGGGGKGVYTIEWVLRQSHGECKKRHKILMPERRTRWFVILIACNGQKSMNNHGQLKNAASGRRQLDGGDPVTGSPLRYYVGKLTQQPTAREETGK